MLRIAALLIAGLIICPISTANAEWTSKNFGCGFAGWPPGVVICNSEPLQVLDNELNELVTKLIAESTPNRKVSGRKIYSTLSPWFDQFISPCDASEACITQAYKDAIDSLRQGGGLPQKANVLP